MTSLYWLPVIENLRDELRQVSGADDRWQAAVRIAGSQLDFLQTSSLDRQVQAKLTNHAGYLELKPVRLAIVGSSTTVHLASGIRVAGLRHGFGIEIYEGEYGQYWQELINPNSGLHRFKPTAILFALDGWHIAADINAQMSRTEVEAAEAELWEQIRSCWQIARETLGATIIHQTPIAVQPRLLGNNEHRLPGSRASYVDHFNHELRNEADEGGAQVLSIDWHVMKDGLNRCARPAALWHRSKQEISPAAVPMCGELVARILAAQPGRSKKCLVLDLENTLWGGVIGADGLAGLVLGPGSTRGEAFAAFQGFCRELARRGIILAVCFEE